MEETTRLPKSQKYGLRQRPEFIDDECSTDSGCSSGDTRSTEHLSRHRLTERDSSFHRYCHHHHHESRVQSQERLSRVMISDKRGRLIKSSRSWSPCELRQDSYPQDSPSDPSSPSDGQSTDSDSLNRSSTTEVFRRALQCLKIKCENNNNSSSTKDKKNVKKSPKRILREPVSYTYIKGLSGLPTQRVPRNSAKQLSMTNYLSGYN